MSYNNTSKYNTKNINTVNSNNYNSDYLSNAELKFYDEFIMKIKIKIII